MNRLKELLDEIVCAIGFSPVDEIAAVEAHVEGLLEKQRQAAGRVVNDALALQHEKINRMESALREIERAANTARPSSVTLMAIADIAAAGLR